MKKFELTDKSVTITTKCKAFQVKALTSFGDVKSGELGGYIEKKKNISRSGTTWVRGRACVTGNAHVSDNAYIDGNACIDGNAVVSGNTVVSGNATVFGNARVDGNAHISGNVRISGNARIDGNAYVSGNVCISGNAHLSGNAYVMDNKDYACVTGFGSICRTTTFFRTKDGGVSVRCGCFEGTIQEFKDKVKQSHGDSQIAIEYLMIADLMELHFGISKSNQE